MAAAKRSMWRCLCNRTPCTGLNCGVWLPGHGPRKKPKPKTPEQLAEIRAKAWATRRKKYGPNGNSKYRTYPTERTDDEQ